MNFKVHCNRPVVLTFALIATVVTLVNLIPGRPLDPFFALGGNFSFVNPFDYLTLFTHTLGHANFLHLLSNMTFLLLLGPILEEKYGSKTLLLMMGITALVTSICYLLLFDNGLLGASGIVFMCITLVSLVNMQDGKIPITFILVFLIFIGQEVFHSFQDNQISEFAHIAGGLCGSAFGFAGLRRL